MQSRVCKPKDVMMSLCLKAAPDCHTGQSKGRYRAFNPTGSHWERPLPVCLLTKIASTLMSHISLHQKGTRLIILFCSPCTISLVNHIVPSL